MSPEGRRTARRRRATPERARPHPFATPAPELADTLRSLGCAEVGEQELASHGVVAWLPAAAGVPLPSPELMSEAVAPDATPELAAWKLQAPGFDANSAPRFLISLANAELPAGGALGDDLRFWITATRFALELLHAQKLMPAIEQEGESYVARWRLLIEAEADRARLQTLVESMPPVCRALAWDLAAPHPEPRELLTAYLQTVTDSIARVTAAPGRTRAGRSASTPSQAEAWVEALLGRPTVAGSRQQLAAFHRQYGAWARPSTGPAADTFRVCFRLEPPEDGAVGDSANMATPPARWTLQYLLQATDDPSLLVPASEVWRQRGSTARFLNRKLEQPQERLLAGLGRASRLFPPIEAGLQSATPEATTLTTEEAYDLVREGALLLQSSGFGVLVPGVETKPGVRLKLRGAGSPGGAGPAAFGWNTLVAYDWQVALGDVTLSREEFDELARLKQPLVQVRGRWIELRPEQVERTLAFFREQGDDGEMQATEALKLALAPDGELGLPLVEVVTEGWIDDLIRELRDGKREEVGRPPGFEGALRPYQQTGVTWLATLRRYGLGACLADDMGLGKSIELIATLLHARNEETERRPALLVCPTSVVGNWRRELERFAPSLKVLVHHGTERRKRDLATEAARHDVVISTYALLPRDEAEFAAVEWGEIVLDEAQNIKNASTKSAQAVRKLDAGWRAALTGTPVENRLSELWSIFRFLNPGYLGSAEEFRRRFAGPIERAGDAAATARLKALVAPFILRRLKTDRSIIQDLPEKNEMKVYCSLTREQATLYEAVVRDSLEAIESATGIDRRGQILKTLTALKQVCDHPALFLHDGSELAGRSGKLARLTEMLEEVSTLGDRALIFTQYAEMGKLLQAHLTETFGREALFLHGGTRAAERDRMVARFQAEGRSAPGVFILSIKAGGTGLNLTRANHVFHFDRWWNPAVENQATDRAFRIGQRRDVQVHKYICAGTFEEAIDELIERKLKLSEAVFGGGESWLTELSTAELRDLFALGRDAVEEG